MRAQFCDVNCDIDDVLCTTPMCFGVFKPHESCFISHAKTGMSALELKRHIGVSYSTVWLVHHKLRANHGCKGSRL